MPPAEIAALAGLALALLRRSLGVDHASREEEQLREGRRTAIDLRVVVEPHVTALSPLPQGNVHELVPESEMRVLLHERIQKRLVLGPLRLLRGKAGLGQSLRKGALAPLPPARTGLVPMVRAHALELLARFARQLTQLRQVVQLDVRAERWRSLLGGLTFANFRFHPTSPCSGARHAPRSVPGSLPELVVRFTSSTSEPRHQKCRLAGRLF